MFGDGPGEPVFPRQCVALRGALPPGRLGRQRQYPRAGIHLCPGSKKGGSEVLQQPDPAVGSVGEHIPPTSAPRDPSSLCLSFTSPSTTADVLAERGQMQQLRGSEGTGKEAAASASSLHSQDRRGGWQQRAEGHS